MTHAHRKHRAFTLVELLVVIGIIGALIAILLPVLSGVQARGRDIKCQSNLRQLGQAILGYAAENRGRVPYGFYWNRSNNSDPNDRSKYDWTEAPDNAGSSGDPDNERPFICWASLLGKYMGKRLAGDNDDANFPKVLQCPEAEQTYTHIIGYVSNFVILPIPRYEAQVTPVTVPLWDRPPTLSQLFPHNILLFDTSVSNGLENSVGYLGGADIDQQRFWQRAGRTRPQYRFFDPADVYGQLPPGIYGNTRPVTFSATWKNIDPEDPTGNGPGYPYQGNLRFRHSKNTSVNCVFSDGHVQSFAAKFNGDKTMYSHDVLRKYFMMKWPTGIPRDESIP